MKYFFLLFCFILNIPGAQGQTQEARQLLLDVEKLASLKNILNELKKGFEILSTGYTTITNISAGNFNLHQAFLNGLLQVSPIVKNYKRIADIISTQIKLVSEYKNASGIFRQSGQFNVDEIGYMGKLYSNLFDQSVRNLESLTHILTANELRMSDDERLGAIDEIWKKVEDQFIFLRHFNDQTKVLALQRAKEQNDVKVISQLYGVNF